MPAAGEVAGASPEKQILDGLGQRPGDVGQLQDLVGRERSRDTLPIASLGDGADAGVTFANSEAYRILARPGSPRTRAPGGSMTIALTNLDGIPREVVIRQLRDRSTVGAAGVLNWGSFETDVLTTVAPAREHDGPADVTVTPAAGAFSLWVGDPIGGDQAGIAIALDRGPRRQSLELGLGPVKPLHEALDQTATCG